MYKWVDKNGNVNFSDTPVAQDAQKYTPPPLQTVPPVGDGKFTTPAKQPTGFTRYQKMTITAPPDDHIFTPDVSATVGVSVNLEPVLQVGLHHKVALYLNGQLHTVGKQTNFTLDSLDRGTYTATASVLDPKNRKLITSDSIQFHIQRHHL